MKTNVTEFIETHDIKHTKVSGGREVIVNPCPFCGTTKNKFYINVETGLFDCKICKEKGNFFKFKKAYGVIDGIRTPQMLKEASAKPLDESLVTKYQYELDRNQEALDYLYSRGFEYETIRKFRLGYVEESGRHWITIPHFSEGQLWNIKYRNIHAVDKENRFKRMPGQPTVLYNIDNIDFEKNGIMLVESETDCISAVQLGITNTVALTAGADTFKPEWLAVFSQFSKIYLLLNTDEAGKSGTDKIAKKIGLKKVRIVELDQNDVNDYLKEGGTHQDLRLKISKGKQIQLEDIKTAETLVNELDEWLTGSDSVLKGLSTGYPVLDNVTRGAKPGDVIVLSGDSGIGKTTFANNVIDSMLRDDKSVLCFYLEGQVSYYFARMIGAYLGIPFTELNKFPDDWQAIKEDASKLKLHVFAGDPSELDEKNIFEFIKGAVELYDIDIILIDNLQLVLKREDVKLEAEFVTRLKNSVVGMNVPCVLISHIRKPERSVSKSLTMHDLKGSSTIYQAADQVWLLQPTPDCYFLTIGKNRMGLSNVDIKFQFNAEIGSFIETDQPAPEKKTSAVPEEKE